MMYMRDSHRKNEYGLFKDENYDSLISYSPDKENGLNRQIGTLKSMSVLEWIEKHTGKGMLYLNEMLIRAGHNNINVVQ